MSELLPESEQDISGKVYIVGAETPIKKEIIQFLRSECNLEPISKEIATTWIRSNAPFDESVLNLIFKHANIVIFLLTGEERVCFRPDFDHTPQGASWLQPTQDQIFEAGYAFGNYHENVFLVRSGEVQPLSDLAGRLLYKFDDPEHRNALKNRLKQLATHPHTPGKRERRSPTPPQEEKIGMTDNDDELQKRKKVFVVFGHNTFIAYEVRAFLKIIGLLPINWNLALEYAGLVAGPPGKALQSAFSQTWAVIVLLTGDDRILSTNQNNNPVNTPSPTFQPRANVLFEAGMAFGDKKLANRTIVIEFACDQLELKENLSNHHRLKLDNSLYQRQEFIHRLRTAGCIIDLHSQEWHKTGNFYFTYKN